VPRSRDKYGWERLSDVQVPRGTLWAFLLGSWLGRRQLNKAIDEFSEPAAELARELGRSWREGEERGRQLVELQASIERMTRWLVRLTVVLGIIGVSGIAATIWATLN
jgi:hypothetical protein